MSHDDDDDDRKMQTSAKAEHTYRQIPVFYSKNLWLWITPINP